ncbi:MAG TPA: alpha/beta family hydrolase [Gemmatimonadaceae bacterium]|nr:alpha/beta family hydrolase [Gemmatimonadaceae bacterium]
MSHSILPSGHEEDGVRDEPIQVPSQADILRGDLSIPNGASGLIIFAHGSGSSRFSSRNRFVAKVLQHGGCATLLLDLLTPTEELVDMRTREHRFNIGLLAARVASAINWARHNERTSSLPVGLFGASTGAAAALLAAARGGDGVRAVVSRGGRPDLAGASLGDVTAPTLFIVGENDPEVLRLNRMAQSVMQAPTDLVVIQGASHLFEEGDTLEQAAVAARDWFVRWLPIGDAVTQPR